MLRSWWVHAGAVVSAWGGAAVSVPSVCSDRTKGPSAAGPAAAEAAHVDRRGSWQLGRTCLAYVSRGGGVVDVCACAGPCVWA